MPNLCCWRTPRPADMEATTRCCLVPVVTIDIGVIVLQLTPQCCLQHRTLTKLRAKHAETPNSTFGINGNSGDIVDMQQLGVWEPYAVKVPTPLFPQYCVMCVS